MSYIVKVGIHTLEIDHITVLNPSTMKETKFYSHKKALQSAQRMLSTMKAYSKSGELLATHYKNSIWECSINGIEFSLDGMI